ncbi:hypothetical protein DV736_g6524, partial [Chaetothyriales sp. CBS 134916]
MSVTSWDVTNFNCDEDEATFAIRACGKLWIVYVRAGDLGEFSGKKDFLSLIQEAHDNYDAEEALYELISDTILQILRDHNSRSIDPLQFTLQDFYIPETLFFKLGGKGSHLTYLPWVKDRPDLLGITPLISLSSITDSSEVPHFDASIAKISPRFGQDPDDVLSSTPSCVTLSENPERYHFKAVQGHQSFLREFQILLKIKQSGLNQKHRLPLIHGLVHYSGKPEKILGVLMKYIEHEATLANYFSQGRITRSLEKKWQQQIMETLQELHSHEIVWGDVKPDNVLIDNNKDAHLIDFGGGFNSEYVDEDVIETVQGDLQGVSRIMEAISGSR